MDVQQQATTLEDEIFSFMMQYDNSYGFLRDTIYGNIERRYETYLSYERNVSHLVLPKYQKIRCWMADKNDYWTKEEEQK